FIMKNVIITIFCFVFIILGFKAFPQTSEKYNSNKNFTIAFYNIENLFDTILSSDKGDSQFLPDSEKKWNSERYNQKIENIAKVISLINENENPEIVGLCEVENRLVLQYLVQNKYIKNSSYKIIHEESPDSRGIDVALLYREDEFTYLSHISIPVTFPFSKNSKVRDILYVKGVINNYDTIHVFVNHWKSRVGGMKETEPKRVFSAMILKNYTDSILKANTKAKIIAMGDFNDEPTNKSLNQLLDANNKQHNFTEFELYNLMYDMHNINNRGTYFYNGEWNMLDNIIVSRNIIYDRIGLHTDYNSGKIFSPDWLMSPDKNAKYNIPFATFSGKTYKGGYSDHLPVYVTLFKE
ncbi:MAG: endonuclease, partial [Bacteroidota bacterium]